VRARPDSVDRLNLMPVQPVDPHTFQQGLNRLRPRLSRCAINGLDGGELAMVDHLAVNRLSGLYSPDIIVNARAKDHDISLVCWQRVIIYSHNDLKNEKNSL
jgi:hypothetical protein